MKNTLAPFFVVSCITFLSILILTDEEIVADSQVFDVLVVNGLVFSGENKFPEKLAVGVRGEKIVYVGNTPPFTSAKRLIDAEGKWVTPGFIDPHTHSMNDLLSEDRKFSRNNLAQGVTTIVTGNDGYGSPYTAQQFENLEKKGFGPNVGLFAGHGAIRSVVMGRENRAPTGSELKQMQALLQRALDEGALGLSTGLF